MSGFSLRSEQCSRTVISIWKTRTKRWNPTTGRIGSTHAGITRPEAGFHLPPLHCSGLRRMWQGGGLASHRFSLRSLSAVTVVVDAAMKSGFFHLVFLSIFLTASPGDSAPPVAEEAGQAGDAAFSPAEDIRGEATRLIREDAHTKLPAGKANLPAPASYQPDEAVLLLEPFVATDKKPLLIPPPRRETTAVQFFRTGVVWEKVGPKVTTRFWIKGDQGMMLSFFW
jgi:hypothetical protein